MGKPVEVLLYIHYEHEGISFRYRLHKDPARELDRERMRIYREKTR